MGCFGGNKSTKKTPSPTQNKQCQKKPWSKDEWKVHGRYFSQLSTPKKNYAEEKLYNTPKQQKVPLSILKHRVEKLSKPKTITVAKHDCPLAPNKCHCHIADPIRKVPNQAKNYVPTHRINALSQPKLDYQEVIRCFPMQRVMCLNKSILTPRSSYRVKKLAMPKYQYLCTPDTNPFGVKPEALVARATPRTVMLAQPKSFSWTN
ncbi:uncharacterized protein LOC134217865 [Armigeres subalbatus]|uniref:uncharacterized protein LOC134217865 n=1 Tax=Armigeres subalbatus TaxID=124917 RepID=UPI002ED50FBF